MAIGTAGAIIGGSLLSGAMGARASRKAAATQAQSAREGMEAQERMFERQLETQAPFRQGGLAAQNMLMRELRRPRQYRPSAGLSAADINSQQFQQTAGLSPGEIAAQQYAPSEGLGINELAAQRFNFEADPGYAFRMSEGLKALERSAAARGGLLSGGAGKAFQRFGQGLASQEYGNAFQRFQQERAARAGLGQMEYGRFANEQARRAGLGQTEYGRFADEQARRQALGQMEYGQFAGERSARLLPLMQMQQSGQGLASNIAGQMANLGAAQAGAAGQIGAAGAAGQIGAANALTGAFGTGANLYMQNQFMNQLAARNPYIGLTYGGDPYAYAASYGQGSL
jgi:hypothetical protein